MNDKKHHKLRNHTRLLIALTALESFRFCFLRLSWWITERSGLEEADNAIFILSCAAIIVGMSLGGLLLKRLKPGAAAIALRALSLSALPFAAASFFTTGVAALTFQFITTMLVASAIRICLEEMLVSVKYKSVGRFFGTVFAVLSVFGAVLFYFPFAEIPNEIILAVISLLLIATAVVFPSEPQDEPEDVSELSEPYPDKSWIRGVFAVLCLYAIIAGLFDNIFFFGEAFEAIPNIMFFNLLYAAFIDIIAGNIFDRFKRPSYVAIIALFLIATGQSLSFFSQYEILAYPYTIMTNSGAVTLEMFLFSLPVLYAKKKKVSSFIPGLGYIALYSGFLITSIAFEWIPQSWHTKILGLVLLLSLAAAGILFYLTLMYLRQREIWLIRTYAEQTKISDEIFTDEERRVAAMLSEGYSQGDIARRLHITAAEMGTHTKNIRGKLRGPTAPESELVYEDVIHRYGITKRESQILRSLNLGKSNSEIADEFILSEETVKSHVRNILKKLPVENRFEIPSWLRNYKIEN
ncbi:MAG: LuxR C-terminal-related transcriptional regulator [Oscillospiraceae bacterium]|jgi:DNA-binding NarL/FixJ family response regulator|nr:LuxR C-terminal-related transcriptional regulator [Oscillospiraceae bacterium]